MPESRIMLVSDAIRDSGWVVLGMILPLVGAPATKVADAAEAAARSPAVKEEPTRNELFEPFQEGDLILESQTR